MTLSGIAGGIARITASQYWAVGRHVITLGGGVILTMAIFNAQDAGTIVEALKSALMAVREIVVQLGVIAAAIGTVMTVVSPLFAGHSASDKSQIKSVEAIAANPQAAQSDAAKTAIVEAAASVAASGSGPESEAAKVAILNAADAIPEVQKIVAPALAASGTGDKVVAQ